ncbi:transcription termination factor NusA [Candidatus Babeliales bacterium]|nr:transcription termination factor NusA [Candidatus Babeliales bacterium]MCF7899537.1 transcription termination factor NusA [Candidatus Babeliales bacterium]
MNLSDVIETLIEERGLDKDAVVSAVCQGVQAAFVKRFPEVNLSVIFNRHSGEVEVFANKIAVYSVQDPDKEISLRKARIINPKAEVDEIVAVPFEHKIGRIEISLAKQLVASKIRDLELAAIYRDFKDKKGAIISGIIHKKERGGFAVKVGENMAFLPMENSIPQEALKVGRPVKALLKDVLPVARQDYQLILDRASADFVRGLLELEIPEIFEGIVEIKKIVRVAGYKTKAIVASNNSDIDPVGTCVGVGGGRIKPILKELGQEKIDLIEQTESLDVLVKNSLKPAEIDKVEIVDDRKAFVWLDQDQRSLAIGKMGQNIMLASRLVGLEIQLQDLVSNQSEEAVIS